MGNTLRPFKSLHLNLTDPWTIQMRLQKEIIILQNRLNLQSYSFITIVVSKGLKSVDAR